MSTWNGYTKPTIAEQPEFIAASQGDRLALAEYFRQGGSVNSKNAKGYSLLMLAAYNDHWGTCAWLIQKGADINSIDVSGNSVLMGSCFKGHVRIVKLLLNSGANPFLQNTYGMTALDLAKAFGRQEVVRILTGEENASRDRMCNVIRLASRKTHSPRKDRSSEKFFN